MGGRTSMRKGGETYVVTNSPDSSRAGQAEAEELAGRAGDDRIPSRA